MFLGRQETLLNNRKRCRFGAAGISVWSSESLMSLIKSSPLHNVALARFEGTDISDKEIMRSLQSHLRINADACIRVALCLSYCFSRADKIVSLGGGRRVAWNEERSPACWINGVNNSRWHFSDYAHTDSPHSTRR